MFATQIMKNLKKTFFFVNLPLICKNHNEVFWSQLQECAPEKMCCDVSKQFFMGINIKTNGMRELLLSFDFVLDGLQFFFV